MMSVAYATEKETLAMTAIMECSFTLKGPGFKDQLMPKVRNCRVGITAAQPCPIGQAIICARRGPMDMDGWRSEKRVFIEAPRIVRLRPIVHARTVLHGISSS